MGRINYYLNGVDIRTFGVHVSAAKGLLSIPERKEGISHSYDDEHGISVDVSAGYVKERKITLSCFTDKMSATDFAATLNTFKLWLLDSGLFQLRVDLGGGSPLAYMVYWSGKCDITAHYDGAKRVGTFDLQLVEPEPVKRVWLIESTAVNQQIEIELTEGLSGKHYSIYWGDGAVTRDITSGNAPTHTYTSAGTYYILLTNADSALTTAVSGDTHTEESELWNILL